MGYITAQAPNKATGLTPTITVLKISDDSVVVNAAAMTETSLTGGYVYNFSTAVDGTDYYYEVDFGATIDGPARYATNQYSSASGGGASVPEIVAGVWGANRDDYKNLNDNSYGYHVASLGQQLMHGVYENTQRDPRIDTVIEAVSELKEAISGAKKDTSFDVSKIDEIGSRIDKFAQAVSSVKTIGGDELVDAVERIGKVVEKSMSEVKSWNDEKASAKKRSDDKDSVLTDVIAKAVEKDIAIEELTGLIIEKDSKLDEKDKEIEKLKSDLQKANAKYDRIKKSLE